MKTDHTKIKDMNELRLNLKKIRSEVRLDVNILHPNSKHLIIV